MQTNTFPIAKEGWKYLAYSFALSLLFLVLDLDFFVFISCIAFCFMLYAFRNPERELSSFEKGSILAPSDGVVHGIEELHDSKYAYRIDIESGFSNIGVLRVPSNAVVSKVQKYNGTRVASNSHLFKDTNENVTLLLEDASGNSFQIVHRLKQSFAPLVVNVSESQKLMQTTRYGFMLNGMTSIYLPSNFRVNVNIANELKASQSLIGYFS